MKKVIVIILFLLVGAVVFAKLGVSYEAIMHDMTKDFKMETKTVSGKTVYYAEFRLMDLEITGQKSNVDSTRFYFQLSPIVSENLYVFTVMDKWLKNTLRYYMGGVSEVSGKVTDMMYTDQKEIVLRRNRYTIQINTDTVDEIREFSILIQ
jgi:hypothetical protein